MNNKFLVYLNGYGLNEIGILYGNNGSSQPFVI
jgi:hypothetical protein